MQLRAPAIVCSTRPHGETAVIARLLTQESGIVAAYVAGGRGRNLRPVVIPGNVVDAEIRARSESQLPYARLELVESRGPWLTEPLPSAAISWVTALTAIALPERHPYPALYDALEALLDAICVAPSARGWALPLLSYEVLLLRELGYGVPVPRPQDEDWVAVLDTFDRLGRELARYPLADRRRDVMAARDLLRERLARI
ncbi:DNA repair protein RecO [Novosphingobium pentaromativorans]|uniref:DNA repair protein RecO n=1 Tax=Novosphingobium pentaromativorans TaxID=205844 RepID=UPI00051F8382|nr:recombination protein O N-terminal domain-containing protein [Novosphingobium pentaromativorans]AIT81518.1 DNA recombination protein RecO [Novosphingobium pentaromativorans US6-1]